MGLAQEFRDSTRVRRRFLVTEHGVKTIYERPQTKAGPTNAALGQSGPKRIR